MANFNIDYLVVAGGGGGTGGVGNGNGTGGGGAGGLITTTTYNGTENVFIAADSTSYDLVIGNFGAGGIGSGLNNWIDSNRGLNGNNSKFSSIEAIGGGGGGAVNTNYPSGATGGSGGGGAPYSNSGGLGTTNQGNSGGAGSSNPGSVNRYRGGGGGGASQSGASGDTSGNGGDGISYTSGQNSITSLAASYAGGGGGGVYSTGVAAGTGGSGGGGNGAQNNGAGASASANTGSGGGGAGGAAFYNGGNGGSGIVILRYTTSDVVSYTTTGLTPTETTDGTDTILSFTTVGTGTITFTTPPPFSGTKVTTPVTDFNKPNTEEGLKIPSGSSSNQPTGVEGMIRNDTTQSSKGSSSTITYYNGTNWRYFENELNTSFNTVIWNGGGLSSVSITGVGFQPDLVWVKQRNLVQYHSLSNSISGVGKMLWSNAADPEYSTTTYGQIASFDSDGFTANKGSDPTYSYFNASGGTYVAWCFKAGGLINKAADFNGSSSYVTLPSNPISGTGDYSVSVWAKCDNLSAGNSGQQYITQFGSIASNGGGSVIAKWANNSGSANKIYIHLGGGFVLTSHVVVLGAWTHYTVTQTGTSILFYVNGNLHDTLTAPYSPNRTSGNSSIGYYNNGSHSYFGGNIQQVRVFNSVLTSSEVTQLYNETKADNSVLNFPNGAGCVAAYPLGENANGLDGLYNGTASNVTFGNPGYLTRNTEGTIESTVSVNNELGFSIVSYTGNGTAGSTVGHGLDSTPEMVIVKSLTSTANQSWSVYQVDVGNNGSLTLEQTTTPYYDIGYWNNTSPTSSVFTLGYYAVSNQNNANYIAYCFTSKPNYSKTGTYTGNGNAIGPIVTLGFEPAFVMIKGVNEASGWLIIDNKRSPSNPANKRLDADDNAAEVTETIMDLNSDNFQLKTSSAGKNAIGKTFIYLAFANTI